MGDPLVAEAIAAGRVPNEVDRALLYESRDRQAVEIISFLFALTFAVVACRTYSRAVLIKRFGLDDTLALVSLVRHFSPPSDFIPSFWRPLAFLRSLG